VKEKQKEPRAGM